MIIPPLKGIYEVQRQSFESRFAILYLCLLVTGIGSWMFHMTLLYEMQLLDELPMVWGSSYMVYCLYKVRVMPKQSTPGIAFLMSTYAILTTVVYLVNQNPLFHEVAYGILVSALLAMDLRLNTTQKSKPGFVVFLSGFLMYALAFALWNIDNIFCPKLKQIRASNPAALAPLTQLHGWWHLLAGYATYLHIQSCIHHRQIFLKKDIEFQQTWLGVEAMRPSITTQKNE